MRNPSTPGPQGYNKSKSCFSLTPSGQDVLAACGSSGPTVAATRFTCETPKKTRYHQQQKRFHSRETEEEEEEEEETHTTVETRFVRKECRWQRRSYEAPSSSSSASGNASASGIRTLTLRFSPDNMALLMLAIPFKSHRSKTK